MTRASAVERPYDPGGEFGPVVEEAAEVRAGSFADHGTKAPPWVARLRAEYDPRWYGIGVPEWAEEARTAAKGRGLAQASGQAGYVPPAAKPPSEKMLERALNVVHAALDVLMRSQRREDVEEPAPPKPAAIVPLAVAEDAGGAVETPAEEVQS